MILRWKFTLICHSHNIPFYCFFLLASNHFRVFWVFIPFATERNLGTLVTI